MTASLIVIRNPFEPVASRSVHAIAPGVTLGALLLDCGITEDPRAEQVEISAVAEDSRVHIN